MYTIWMGATNGRGCVLYAKNIASITDAAAALALYGNDYRSSRFRLTAEMPGGWKLTLYTGTGWDAAKAWGCLVTDEQRELYHNLDELRWKKADVERKTARARVDLKKSLGLPVPPKKERKQPDPVVVKKWEKERIKREAEIHAANESRAFEF